MNTNIFKKAVLTIALLAASNLAFAHGQSETLGSAISSTDITK